jgi:hypothetical protein
MWAPETRVGVSDLNFPIDARRHCVIRSGILQLRRARGASSNPAQNRIAPSRAWLFRYRLLSDDDLQVCRYVLVQLDRNRELAERLQRLV